MKKRIFSLLLIILINALFFSSILAQTVSDGVVNVSVLNVRSGPGIEFSRVGQVHKGQKVDVYVQQNGWIKIDSTNRWVKAQYIDIDNANIDSSEIAKDIGTVNTAVANIRSGPSTSHAIIGTIRKGMNINIINEENNWYYFDYHGQKGWIAGFLVNRNNDDKPKTQEIAAFDNYKVIISENVVNIRSGPGLQHSIVGRTQGGTEFEVTAEKNGWLKVRNQQQSGYIADWLAIKKEVSNNLAVIEPETKVSNEPAFDNYKVIISENVVNIRSGPGLQHSIVGRTQGGTEFEVTAEKNGWLKVRNQQQSGYIADWLAIKIDAPNSGKTESPSDPVRKKIVVIDPGHGTIRPGGWADPGAISPFMRIRELDVVLAISQRLEVHLKNKGYEVYMTHRGTTHRDLYDRSYFANELNADVFVSIHANASPNRLTQGIALFYFAPEWMPDLLAQKGQRLQLSQMILNEARTTTGRPANGIYERNFVVLRETTMPSVIVETGFLTNQTEERLLIDPVFQEQMALGIANGIEKFLER